MNSNKIFCDNNYTIEYTESMHTTNDTRPVYKTVVEKEKRIKNHWESQAPTVNIGGIEINAEKHIMDETEKNIRAIEKKMSFTYKNLFNGILGILIATDKISPNKNIAIINTLDKSATMPKQDDIYLSRLSSNLAIAACNDPAGNCKETII